MPVTAVIGGQWGDEGKGKIVDLLCAGMDYVARYQGGANAGHTVQIDDATFVLHQVPSGILHPATHCILGQGMVIDPAALVEELDTLAGHGIDTEGRILISSSAHIVNPLHKHIDARTGDRIGTTGKGIGPAYADKARRIGMRAADLLNTRILGDYLVSRLKLAESQGDVNAADTGTLKDDLSQFIQATVKLQPMVTDTIATLHNALDAGKNILIEGAQGTLLDLDLGTYPYVTSSHPTTGGMLTGLGLPPQALDQIVGIFKAYTTRVGAGPFPTELHDDDGKNLQKIGSEVGATTGRPRRCGWFDAVAARYAARINGFTEVVITKLDVLDTFDTIQVCTGYELHGAPIESFSSSIHNLHEVTPIYKQFPGWKSDLSAIQKFADLPPAAATYILYLEELLGVPVSRVSVGPERNQILTR